MSLNDLIKIIIEAIIKTLDPRPTPPPTDVNYQLLQLHNNYRQQSGLKPLILNQALLNAAQKH